MDKQHYVMTNALIVRGGICGAEPGFIRVEGNRIAETGPMSRYVPEAGRAERNLNGS